MKIHSKQKTYNLIVKKDFLFISKLKKIDNSFFIVDKNIYDIYNSYFDDIKNLYIINAIENNKNINTALKICEQITKLNSKRNTVLISFGGGIVQDITGFVSNITYRGIKWIYVPTTLLAMCDSCIGGKTSLNYKKYKNLLGTFYPPDEIYVCSEFAKTLKIKDYNSGLGEVFKFSIMQGTKCFSYVENNLINIINRDEYYTNECIIKSLEYKKSIIEKDEFDRGERIKLNFAHTFGHAIETITNYSIPHGTSVAIGTIIANYISYSRGWISEGFINKCEKNLLKIIKVKKKDLIWDFYDFVDAMHKDKKQINKSFTIVLLGDENGKINIVNDIEIKEIRKAVNHFVKIYGVKNENKCC